MVRNSVNTTFRKKTRTTNKFPMFFTGWLVKIVAVPRYNPYKPRVRKETPGV